MFAGGGQNDQHVLLLLREPYTFAPALKKSPAGVCVWGGGGGGTHFFRLQKCVKKFS